MPCKDCPNLISVDLAMSNFKANGIFMTPRGSILSHRIASKTQHQHSRGASLDRGLMLHWFNNTQFRRPYLLAEWRCFVAYILSRSTMFSFAYRVSSSAKNQLTSWYLNASKPPSISINFWRILVAECRSGCVCVEVVTRCLREKF